MNTAETYTLQHFIAVGNTMEITHYKSSLLETMGDYNEIHIATDNIFYSYLDELLEVSATVELTDTEYNKYIYSPEILAYDVYGYTDFFFIILMLNNLYDVKEFTIKKIKLIKPSEIAILGRIINAEQSLLNYNRNNL